MMMAIRVVGMDQGRKLATAEFVAVLISPAAAHWR
jgi:hypothetical protein